MVELDAQLALFIHDVAKRVLHLGLGPVGCGEEVIAHRECVALIEDNIAVLESYLGPSFDGEPRVLGTSVV